MRLRRPRVLQASSLGPRGLIRNSGLRAEQVPGWQSVPWCLLVAAAAGPLLPWLTRVQAILAPCSWLLGCMGWLVRGVRSPAPALSSDLEAGLRRTRGARADGRSAPCAQALVPNSVRTPLNLIRPLPLLCTHARMHACIQHPACSMPAAMLPVACCLRRHPRRASVRDSSTVRHLLCLLSIFLPLPRPPGPSALSSKLCARQSESHHLDQCHAAVLRCIPAAPTLPRFHRSSLSLLELVAELVRPVPSSHHLTDESLACTPNFFFETHFIITHTLPTRTSCKHEHTTRPDPIRHRRPDTTYDTPCTQTHLSLSL